MILVFLACIRATSVEPLPTAYHREMESLAATRVPDPRRNGPVPLPDASPLPPFLGVDRGVSVYVGEATCAACHADAARRWAVGPHAESMPTLERAQSAHAPDCIRCHVTGFGHPGGYQTSADTPLAAVGCEACHGPGSAHVAAPNPDYGALPADGSACVACHTHDQSPEFRWDRFWPRIAH